MSFPRLYIQYRSDPPIEILRGAQITDDNVKEMAENLSEHWGFWADHGMTHPEGAHYSVTKRGRAPAGMTRAEMQAIPQDVHPFGMTGSFGKAEIMAQEVAP